MTKHTHKCVECGARFTPTRNKAMAKFCDAKCRNKAWVREHPRVKVGK